MALEIEINNLHCHCASAGSNGKIAYILYPIDILSDWIEPAAEKYETDIAVITDMDWQNVFSPWPAKGVPHESPDFKGESPQFLKQLQDVVIPKIEKALGHTKAAERTLVGVSMSGLFALWQWMLCDTFVNIASLSGSFWYEGFVNWMKNRDIPKKTGRAYFLLGDSEAKSKIKAFKTVARDTQEIMSTLDTAGIRTEFQSVPGNHYSHPIERLDNALSALFPMPQ